MGVVPAVILSKGAFSKQFEFIEEVVVLATVVKVVVQVSERNLKHPMFPEATIVVHVS